MPAERDQEPSIHLQDVSFAWPGGEPVLRVSELRIEAGERVFLHGPSGCGKSTLLGLIAGILRPQQGRLEILGTRLEQLGQSARDRFRAEHVGLIFQMFNLLPFLPVRDNILLGCRFAPRRRARALARGGSLEGEAARLITRLGLSEDMLRRSVKDLSIGQQQRVAVARALMGVPEIIVADEPTSALDVAAQRAFLDLVLAECEGAGSTLLFVSHDVSLARRFERSLDLEALNGARGARLEAS